MNVKYFFQRYLLFMAPDNTLQDCDGIVEGSAIDSEIIQDYKKGNQMHLQMNPNKTSKKVPACPIWLKLGFSVVGSLGGVLP